MAALGTTRDEMRLDTLGLQETKHYFHHYNFPPFSVGEAGFMRGPKRRDIGHGARGAGAAGGADGGRVPVHDPRGVGHPRVQRLELDGLGLRLDAVPLMDAGVPIKAPVAGVAMGLIKEGDDIVLTDIAGVEDYLGDMDFKVAGTSEGITALQMDIKITGVTFDILRDALRDQDARLSILGKMGGRSPSRARAVPVRAAHLTDPDRHREDRRGDRQGRRDDPGAVRGVRRTDRHRRRRHGAHLRQSGDQGDALTDRIRSMTKEVEVGDEFTGKVVKTTTFGAFIELAKGTDGLLHISNIKPGERVNTVEDVVNRGDELVVKVVEVDRERGRIGLRLAEDPEISGKSADELASMGTGDKGGRGDPAAAAGRGRRQRRPA